MDNESTPKLVPEEHVAALERGLDQLDAGLGREWDPEDFLRRFMDRYHARQLGHDSQCDRD